MLAFLFLFHPAFSNMSKTSGGDIQETREDTERIQISCSVKGYHECRFSVDLGEEFLIYKKIGSRGRTFKVTNTRGQFDFVRFSLISSIGSKIELTAK